MTLQYNAPLRSKQTEKAYSANSSERIFLDRFVGIVIGDVSFVQQIGKIRA